MVLCMTSPFTLVQNQMCFPLQAAATDIDENENAQIVYTIQATSTDFAFASDWSIDSNGGWSPVNQLDYDAGKRVYEFLVNANGVLDATKTDSTNLEITITNCNDNAPFYAGTTNLYFSIGIVLIHWKPDLRKLNDQKKRWF